MRRRLSLLLTLTAWFFATGSQWDVAQTFGWARMFASYAQTMPVLEALQKTFSGDELCGVCDAVQDAKQGGSDTSAAAGAKSLAKVPLMLPPGAWGVVHLPPPAFGHPPTVLPLEAPRATPPLPPPRATA